MGGNAKLGILKPFCRHSHNGCYRVFDDTLKICHASSLVHKAFNLQKQI